MKTGCGGGGRLSSNEGTKTAGNSRPLAFQMVSTWTASARLGSAWAGSEYSRAATWDMNQRRPATWPARRNLYTYS